MDARGRGSANTGGYDFVVPTGAGHRRDVLRQVEARDWNGTLSRRCEQLRLRWTTACSTRPANLVTAFALEPIASNPARGAAPVRFATPRGGDVRV